MKPLFPIVFIGCLTCAPLLAADPPPLASLFKAIRDGDSAAVQKLLKDGADLNARNELDDTPLMAAAWQANVEVLEMLINAGADVNAKNRAGATPLLRAATFEDKVRLLVSKGADVKARTKRGNTALILAARGVGNSGAVKELLDHGADVNENNRGWTALVSAVFAQDTDTVRLLFDRSEKNRERAPSGAGSKTVAEAIRRALPPLTRTAEETVPTYLRHSAKQRCISCHQQFLPTAAFSLADSRHFETDRAVTRHQIELIKRVLDLGVENGGEKDEVMVANLQVTVHEDPAMISGLMAMNMRLENQPASPSTDAMCHLIAMLQRADGHWQPGSPRPPIQGCAVSATASSVTWTACLSFGTARPLSIVPTRTITTKSTAKKPKNRGRSIRSITADRTITLIPGGIRSIDAAICTRCSR